jgi:hypothetical protein
MTFLRALEGRSDMIDQRGEQARMAFEAARKALEDVRKPPQPSRATHPLSTQGAHTNASGGTSITPVPPTPKA